MGGRIGANRRRARQLLAVLAVLVATAIRAQPQADIERLVAAGSLAQLRWPDFRAWQPSVRELYAGASWAPAWFQGNRLTPQGEAVIQLFQSAWQKGLNPEDYDASRWTARRESLQRSPSELAAFDVAVTVSAIRYLSDLRVGRVNPKHVGFDLVVERRHYDVAQFLSQRVLVAPDVAAAVAAIEPPFGGYQRTEQALARYTELARGGDGATLPVPAKAIEPGADYAAVEILAKRLQLLGDLPSEAAAAVPGGRYEGELVTAVKRFQRRHGLDDDGRLGATTVKQLNVPLAARVEQLRLALERWRWLPQSVPAPPIIVNIPDFRLRALEADNRIAMDMRVVVGKVMGTQTPVFSRDMTYVVFRPYWGVPPGIMRRQIIPAILKDRNYIADNRYEVVMPDGRVVTSGVVTDDVLAQLRAGKLMVRQKPGPKNALGLVKLMFPNEYHVYLHSTPSTELFARTQRAFSSGCIRVEQPAELTAWALRNSPGWTLERARQAMESGRDNVTVRLAQPIPVFIVYGTALAHPDGEVHFYDDIYGHDPKLTAALAKANP